MKVEIGGRIYALTRTSARGSNLPKRWNSEVELIVNGNPDKLRVTNNAAWCGEPKAVLEYIWIKLDSGAYYVTLDYGVSAASLAGETFDVSEGVGPKPPTRTNGTLDRTAYNFDKCETEAGRILKFKATMAAKG